MVGLTIISITRYWILYYFCVKHFKAQSIQVKYIDMHTSYMAPLLCKRGQRDLNERIIAGFFLMQFYDF